MAHTPMISRDGDRFEQWLRASTTETLDEYVAIYEHRLNEVGFGPTGSLPDWWQVNLKG